MRRTGVEGTVEATSLSLAAPVPKWITAEDAARLVAFLTSEEAEWVTGQLIRSRGSA